MASKPYKKRMNEKSQDLSTYGLPADGIGVVYILGSSSGQKVKIGYTGNKHNKLARLLDHAKGDAFGDGGDFTVLALVRGTRANEQAIHSAYEKALAAPGRSTEVFWAEQLVPYIVWLRDQYFVSTSLAELESAPGQSAIDSQFWLPREDRASSRRTEPSLLTIGDPWGFLPSRVITGDDYYTPEEIISVARSCLGEIDLDPASHVHANQVVRAKSFYTMDQNGLTQPWYGRVWLNPPFSQWAQWVVKLLAELDNGHVDEALVLAATRTLTAQYFVPLLNRLDAICIASGRYGFWGVDNASTPPDGHVVMYVGRRPEHFQRSMAPLGVVFRGCAERIQEALPLEVAG